MTAGGQTVVVGGGIVGACCAYYLAKRGRRVILLEREDSGESASAGNAGIVAVGHLPLPRPGLAWQAVRWMLDRDSPLYIPPRLDPGLLTWLWRFHRSCNARHLDHCMDVLAALGKEAIPCWEEIIAAEEIACSWRRDGWLEVYTTAAGQKCAEHDAALVARYGFDVEEVGGKALRSRDPAFGDNVLGAIHYAGSAFLDPGLFLAGLLARLPDLGVEVRRDATVTRLLVADGRCHGVELAGGEHLPAEQVVLAAGVWSSRLAGSVGLRLPLQAGKGYHLDLEAPEPCPRTACVVTETFVAVTPMDGRLRLAGTLEFSGINQRLVQRRLDMLRTGAARCLPGVTAAAVLSRWCGLRPCTADGLPVVGWAPGIEGLFVATGHAKMGLTLGPITGRLVSECLLDGEASLDIAPMRVGRL